MQSARPNRAAQAAAGLTRCRETSEGTIARRPAEGSLSSQPAAQGAARKGYSLYSRDVSSTPDETPVPRGTSTPSRVILAEGSGVVLPKPAKQKARAR